MAGDGYRLVIGNKTYSSWSLRPWLALRHGALPFEEIRIDLRAPDKADQIRAISPTGKIPALYIGDELVCDSLAILETLAERHPELALWPRDPLARAQARSVSAEMHSSFQGLRNECPMDLNAHPDHHPLSEAARADVARIVTLVGQSRRRFGGYGAFLFGAFTNADAMYSPVAWRFSSYIGDLTSFGDDGTAASYFSALRALPAMQTWLSEALAEPRAG